MTAEARARLRRSMHFVPGANEKMLLKSLSSQADSLVLDLEDAVIPEHKIRTRRTIAEWLRDIDFGDKEVTVRINPLDTPWGFDDLKETMQNPPDAYVVPKPSHVNDLDLIDTELTQLERFYGHPRRSVSLILIAAETPEGALNLPTFGACPRIVAMSWGAEDLSAALGAPRNRNNHADYLGVYEYCRQQTLLCAVATRVQPIDSVYVDLANQQAFERECHEGASLGFTGKITIHPDQIPVVNSAFTPNDADVDAAQRLLKAFEEAKAEGKLAFRFEGQMVDAPHVNRARALLQRACQAGVTQ